MDLKSIGGAIMGMGVVVVAVGALFWLAGRFGLGRLPGDIVIRRGSFTFVFPLATGLLLSVVATVLLNLWLRRRG